MICRCVSQNWPICKTPICMSTFWWETFSPYSLCWQLVLEMMTTRSGVKQINEFKVNSSDSNQLDEEHIGSVSTLAHHDNQLRPGEILESRYTCGNGTHRKFTCEKGKIETCVKDALFWQLFPKKETCYGYGVCWGISLNNDFLWENGKPYT